MMSFQDINRTQITYEPWIDMTSLGVWNACKNESIKFTAVCTKHFRGWEFMVRFSGLINRQVWIKGVDMELWLLSVCKNFILLHTGSTIFIEFKVATIQVIFVNAAHLMQNKLLSLFILCNQTTSDSKGG